MSDKQIREVYEMAVRNAGGSNEYKEWSIMVDGYEVEFIVDQDDGIYYKHPNGTWDDLVYITSGMPFVSSADELIERVHEVVDTHEL